jgi:hypothetical protein
MERKEMSILTDTQIKEGYFRDIGGFPPLNETDDRNNYARDGKDTVTLELNLFYIPQSGTILKQG